MTTQVNYTKCYEFVMSLTLNLKSVLEIPIDQFSNFFSRGAPYKPDIQRGAQHFISQLSKYTK